MAITTKLETITPKQAQLILDHHNTRNRPIRQNYVERIARTILDGDFRLTHQGLAFNCDGTLIDGQHRLAAIALSGKPVKIMVTRGLAQDARDSIDLGSKRNVADVLSFGNESVSTIHVAVARIMYGRGEASRGESMTVPSIARFLYQHWDAVDFAADPKGVRNFPAVVRGVVARAWYTQDRARLGQFKNVIVTGIMNSPEDAAAIRLRNALNGAIKITRTTLYWRAENAVSKFIQGEPIIRLYDAPEELFPIPGEEPTPLLDGAE